MPAAEHVAARAAEGVGEASLDSLESHDPGEHFRLLGPEQVLRDRIAFRREELGGLFEPKPGSLTERYNRQSVDGLGLVQPAKPGPLNASDQTVALVVVQRRSGEPRAGTDLTDVEKVAYHDLNHS
jgi:hypothetical protein